MNRNLNWDTLENQTRLQQDESKFRRIVQAAAPAASDHSANVVHVEFASEPKAFTAPVTEIGLLTLKSPEKKGKLTGMLSRWEEISQGMLTFGQAVGYENIFVLVCGWPSVEVCASKSTLLKRA
jgi:hypothetical protein